MASVESYSKCPESNVPTTVTCLNRGATPAGVTWPLGATRVTVSPCCTPMAAASCLPSTTPKLPGVNCCKAASLTAAMLVTRGSMPGSMPRTITPRMVSPRTSNDWPDTNGAAATTCGCLRTFSMSTEGSVSACPKASYISTCDTTLSMRSRTSFWKPFMTERTTISAHTPSAMPITDAAEMKEMKPLRRAARPARVYRQPISSSYGESMGNERENSLHCGTAQGHPSRPYVP